MAILSVEDVQPFVEGVTESKLAAMVADVSAMATVAAPCLLDPGLPEPLANAARATLRAAVIRWADSDSGVVQTVQAGPFSQTLDTSQRRSGLLWPSEIRALQDVCRHAGGGRQRAVFTVNTLIGTPQLDHSDICSVLLGDSCSCGAVLTGSGPLAEQ